jgi:hypothetical protein
MILTCSVGKTRLWQGQPFLAKTALDPTPDELIDSSKSSPFHVQGTSFVLKEEPTSAVLFRRIQPDERMDWVEGTPIEMRLAPGVVASETLDIDPGVYEVKIIRESLQLILPELIWILNRDDYVALARKEASEEFQMEPLVSTPAEFRAFFLSTVFGRWPICPARFEISYMTNAPVAYAPIAWTVSAVVDAFKYLGIFGLRNANGFISVGDDLIELGLEAEMEYPLPGPVIDAFNDSECSDLRLMKGESYLDDFDIDITVDYGHAKVTVRQRLPVPAIA